MEKIINTDVQCLEDVTAENAGWLDTDLLVHLVDEASSWDWIGMDHAMHELCRRFDLPMPEDMEPDPDGVPTCAILFDQILCMRLEGLE